MSRRTDPILLASTGSTTAVFHGGRPLHEVLAVGVAHRAQNGRYDAILKERRAQLAKEVLADYDYESLEFWEPDDEPSKRLRKTKGLKWLYEKKHP